MTAADELKARARARIETHAAQIIEFSETIMRQPEPGYAETATAARVTEWLDELGIPCRDGLALTGVKATLRGRTAGPTVGLLGELDAVVVPEHPLADPVTGAAHACGHHAQLAAMLGAGLGLIPVMDELDGNVALFAVPAEEFMELDHRLALRDRGEAEFPVGKAELIRLGEFSDIDLAILVHTGGGTAPRFGVGDTFNGAIVKRARFGGRAAHAGGRPWLGTNALKAATLAIQAIDAQRDTFPDTDLIRVNPVMTQTEAVPSVVPGTTTLEVLVRARTLDALRATGVKVDRALRSGALALGTGLEVETLLAYLPLTPDPALDDVVEANALALLGPIDHARGRHLGSCTDMGDLGHIMPVSHPFTSGAKGGAHSTSYQVTDHHQAAVEPAIYLAGAVIDLLAAGASKARTVIEESQGKLSVPEYIASRRELNGYQTWSAE